MRRWWWLALLLALLLAACGPIADDGNQDFERVPSTQPFQPGGAGPTSTGGGSTPAAGGLGVPLASVCTDAEFLHGRCNEETVQRCQGDRGNRRWEDELLCSATGRICSERPEDCLGFFNEACCVGTIVVPTTTPTGTTPPTTTPTTPTTTAPTNPTGAACAVCPIGCSATQCRVCTTGKACGNTCIAQSDTCQVGAGCACNG